MVTAKLYGRLGNRLFQKAAAIGYSEKHGVPFTFDTPPPTSFYGKNGKTIHKESSHSYTEIPFYKKTCPSAWGLVLDGYFQSEKYFSHCRETVLQEFGFKWEHKSQWVAIHVRRGDYLLYPDKHPVVTVKYCEKAMAYFAERGYTAFMVFSDDIPWCQEAFSGLPYTFAFSIGRDEREDLELMSGCAHQICSNSTYAWWGYFLNQNPDKIGIMPAVWFGPGNAHLETKDIYPENVIIL